LKKPLSKIPYINLTETIEEEKEPGSKTGKGGYEQDVLSDLKKSKGTSGGTNFTFN
jgi:hypothetical protein